MDVFTKILLTIIGTGFFGNIVLYFLKRRDANINRDKELLDPIIDEICKICFSAETFINNSNRISKRLVELHKKQLKLFQEADNEMQQYNILQDELMAIYSKETITTSDKINIPIIQKQEDEHLRKRGIIMDEALKIPNEEKRIISEFNIEIHKEISHYNGLTHRLTNTYKFSNKKTSKKVSQQLTMIDNALKKIINSCESYPNLQLSPPLLFYLYKIATDCRLKLTQIND